MLTLDRSGKDCQTVCMSGVANPDNGGSAVAQDFCAKLTMSEKNKNPRMHLLNSENSIHMPVCHWTASKVFQKAF